ncbi:MAG: aminotransferase class I/II-fold pyridoxal phosphate-dependent enzyme [Actinomycetota bacterium]
MTAQSYHIRGATANEISRSIEDGIRAGRLERGEQLPSVRALALRRGVSPVTVASAYKALRRRGLITTGGRRGTQVANRPPLSFHALPPSPPSGRNLYDGNPDGALLPRLDEALAQMPAHSRLYDDLPAYPPLVEVARAGLKADGVPAEAITVTSGAFDAIQRVLDAHIASGDAVAIEDPGYHRTTDLLAALGMAPMPVRVDELGPIPSSLQQAIKRGARALIVTPRAQNPTGAAIDAKRARELRAIIAREPEFLVIEDDHAGAISGVGYNTLVDKGRQRWAVVRSFSKYLGPDLRLAVLAGDDETVARVEGLLSVGPGWVSYIIQRLAAALLTDPKVLKQIRDSSKAYAQRRGWMIDALTREGIKTGGRSGLNIWVPVLEEQRAVPALSAAGFAIRAGEPFRLDAPPAVRLTISRLQKGEAEQVAAELARVLRARVVYSA